MPCATSEIKPIKKEEKSNPNLKSESITVLLETTGEKDELIFYKYSVRRFIGSRIIESDAY